MRFTFSVSAVLAMAASAFAQAVDFDSIYSPASGQTVTAGSDLIIQWDAPQQYAADVVSITLIGGATQGTQQILNTIATSVLNSAQSYTWAIPASEGSLAVYGFIIRSVNDPTVFQYSNPFHIQPPSSSNPSPSSNPGPSPNPNPSSNKPAGAASTTVTTPYGIQTVSLSSQGAAPTHLTTLVPAPAPTTVVSVFRNATATAPSYNATSTMVTLATSTRLPPPQTYVNGGGAGGAGGAGDAPTKVVTTAPWATPSAIPPNSNGTAPSHGLPISDAGARVGASSVLFIGSLVMAILAL